MHPLAAIGLVLLTGIGWTVTVLTLLVVLAKSRQPPAAEARDNPLSDPGAPLAVSEQRLGSHSSSYDRR
ncbi:hypothetical protein [Pseudarthrobacter chlorophenolicus]|uniref:hypothetical protein n=1 Tax=Pseudarthrobacter chlorophenolicus TaxID=85085 RepID=UPI0005F29968|nr:hypothetical protein [Pseudarthrobacter chlorophenolicus]